MIAGKNISEQNSVPQVNFRVRAGNTWSYTFDATYIDSNGDEQNYDFTDAVLLGTMRGTSEVRMQVSVSSNTVTLSLPQKLTKNLSPQLMDWDLILMESNGDYKTLIEGTFEVLKSVTYWEQIIERVYKTAFGLQLAITSILAKLLTFTFQFSSRISITTIEFVLRTMGLSFESRVNIWVYISKAFSFSFDTQVIISQAIRKTYSHFFSSGVYFSTLLRKMLSNAFLSRITVVGTVTKGYVCGFSSRVTLT